MPNAIVFPGGVTEKEDSHRNWLDLYSRIGVKDSRLHALGCASNTDFIYQKSSEEEQIERELSLRISAIRETFEEVGILLARGSHELQSDSSGLYAAAVRTGFDVHFWQKEVQHHPGRFYDLCHTLQVVPDVFALHGWANWMTPTTVGKHRFDTIFFTASLVDRPEFAMDEKEAQHVLVRLYSDILHCSTSSLTVFFPPYLQWTNPSDVLAASQAETIYLPPPQVYELSKFEQMKDFEQMAKYCQWRSQFGTSLLFPVQYPTKGRMMHVFPGDDLYPKEPNHYEKHADFERYSDQEPEELLRQSKNIHRTLHETMSKSALIINIVPERQHLSAQGGTVSFEELRAVAKL